MELMQPSRWPELRGKLNGINALPVGSSIKLHTLSSGEIDEAICGLPKQVTSTRRDDAISLTERWTEAFSRAVQVPDDCVFFSWSCDGYMSYQVAVVFLPLSDERHEELVVFGHAFPELKYHMDEVPCCSVCASLRGDEEWKNVRKQTCGICKPTPTFLCYRCRVTVGKGAVRCYLCLTEEELVRAKEDNPHESLRLSLLTVTECPYPKLPSSSAASGSTLDYGPWRQCEAIDDEASAPTRDIDDEASAPTRSH